MADATGKIEITKIPDGKQTIVFSFVGYENLEFTSNFPLANPNQETIIYLQPKNENLKEVIVTSTRTNSRISACHGKQG